MADEEPAKEQTKFNKILKLVLHIVFHILFGAYFIWATYTFISFDKEGDLCQAELRPNITESATEEGQEEEPKLIFVWESKSHILCHLNWCRGFGFLIILFISFYILWTYYFLLKPLLIKNEDKFEPTFEAISKVNQNRIFNLVTIVVLLLIMAILIGVMSISEPLKMRAICGPILFIGIGVLCSKHIRLIPWSTVVRGIFFQFIIALMCMRLSLIQRIFLCMTTKMETFLRYSAHGANFAFSEKLAKTDDGIFAFSVLPVMFFISVCISVLYYWGVMQVIVVSLGWLIQIILGTTICESTNAIANVFMSLVESPVIIGPYMNVLTKSELHAICTSGFATTGVIFIAGYYGINAPLQYLLAAMFISVPGALAFAKLFYPESEESQTKSGNIEMPEITDKSCLDAAANGASIAMKIVLAVIANTIAFIAIVGFLNGVTEWAFELTNNYGISFSWLLTQMLVPIVYIMGVEASDCEAIAGVIGLKIMQGEVLAYKKLNDLYESPIQLRSRGIAAIAICGHATIASFGMLLGGLTALAPDRKTDITSGLVRAYLAGCLTCFTSAAFAGFFMELDDIDEWVKN